MMKDHDKSRKQAMKDGYIQLELTPMTSIEEQSPKLRQVMDTDVDSQSEKTTSDNIDVQTENTISTHVHVPKKKSKKKHVDTQPELTLITLDDQQPSDQQHTMNEVIDMDNNPSGMVDEPHTTVNEEEILVQNQVAIVPENSNKAPQKSRIKNLLGRSASAKRSKLKAIDYSNQITTDRHPIVGYAEEPLLPLARACAPLNDVLHNLPLYVQKALDETPETPPDGLTIDESAAIRLYTIEWEEPHRSLYSSLNYTLKNADAEQLRPYFKYMKLFITALAKLPCVPPLTVWRGVTKNLSEEFPPGTQVTWWSFSSCTTALTVLENDMYLGNSGSRTLFSVEAINGRTIQDHSHFVTEDEILLLPGTYMVVQSQLSPAPDLHIIHLKQEIPEQTLLELPFEGNLDIFNHLFLK
jgi:hypothetical protein